MRAAGSQGWPMSGTAITQLRIIGLIEGLSFVVLLAVAMPLKYLYGMPGAVSIVGMLHGIFFIIYGVALMLSAVPACIAPSRSRVRASRSSPFSATTGSHAPISRAPVEASAQGPAYSASAA